MLCTVILTFLISHNNRPYESRTKYLDEDTLTSMLMVMRGSKSTEFKIKDIKVKRVKEFDCSKEPK